MAVTRKKIHYSQVELDFVKNNCTMEINQLHQAFCKQFGRNDVNKTNIQALRKRNGWKTGRTGRFEKGNKPLPSARPAGPNKTSFKKGNVPANITPLYTERVRDDGWLEIKIPEPNPYTRSKTRYRLKHLWVWEKENGPVPENHVVTFKDGDKLNCAVDNLELLPRGVNSFIKRPKYNALHDELKPAVKTLALLNHKIKSKENVKANI